MVEAIIHGEPDWVFRPAASAISVPHGVAADAGLTADEAIGNIHSERLEPGPLHAEVNRGVASMRGPCMAGLDSFRRLRDVLRWSLGLSCSGTAAWTRQSSVLGTRASFDCSTHKGQNIIIRPWQIQRHIPHRMFAPWGRSILKISRILAANRETHPQ